MILASHHKYNLKVFIVVVTFLTIMLFLAYGYVANAYSNTGIINHNASTHYVIDKSHPIYNYILISNLHYSHLIYYPSLLVMLSGKTDWNEILLAQNLDTNSTNRNEETQYFDDLNIVDESIYERYFYKKEQFRFLKPPQVDRNSMSKKQLRNINPNGWIEHFAIDETEYRSNYNIDVRVGEYFSTIPIEDISPTSSTIDTSKNNQLGGTRRPLPQTKTDSVGTKKSNFNPNVRNSYNITAAYSKPLDQYLAERKEKLQSKIYDSLISTYDVKKAMSRSDLASFLGQAAGFSIPLPPNPLLNIFGKPEIGINVNGQVNLTLGWRLDVQNLGTASVAGQVQSSPIFKQDIRVDVNARIGDKLKFNINHNTRSFFEFDKKFKIGYEGYEDDIIKKVEVGNILFETPSTLISSASELFGVGATFQFGPLFLQTAVSQKKGQKAMIDVTGGTSKQQFSVHAWNYARNHFFLDTAYKAVYNEYFKYSTPIPPKSASHLRIKQIQVWEANTDMTNPHVSQAIAIADLHGVSRKMGEDYTDAVKHAPMQTGFVEKARFSLLDSQQYVIDYTLGTLTLKNFREDRYYAVAYRIEGPTIDTTDDITFGYFSNQIGINSNSSGGVATTTDTIILKLIYRPNLLPAYTQLWTRQMRNTYNVGMNNVNLADTKIEVWYTRKSNDSTEMLDGANDKLATILRIDRITNSTGSEPPDGIIDINNPAIFNPQTGELTFPHSEPFANGLVEYFESIGNKELANQYVYRQIYDTTVAIAQKNTAKDRFLITGEITGRASNSISLNAYNLSPGSVKVYLDGTLLREYDDYTVEYSMGRLTIKNPRALLPNANVRVEYEQRDVFMTSTKTFFGLRADYELFKNRWMTATLGATAVRYSQAVISDRARLGDEPIANTMFGFDIRFNADAPWLTQALDYLPFYDTKAPSSINLFAEAAMVMPTPNRVRSEITSDNNEPVAEVDNFESVTRSTTLSTSFTSWTHSSAPINPIMYDTTLDKTLSEIEQGKVANNYRGRMWWWQYSNPRVDRKEVYPENQSYQSGYQNNISVLYVYFDPEHRGIYNENENYLDNENPNFSYPAFYEVPNNKEKIWGGIMRILSTGSTNFDNDNVEFLDVMVRVDQNLTDLGSVKVYFDIGMINEDVISNGYGDTEDGIIEDNPIPNGIIDLGEDVGLDARNDSLEKVLLPPLLAAENDPARDNFYFDFGKDDWSRGPADYIRYNLPQGNSGNDMGAFPDKEMLNSNNGQTLSTDNAYFTYELNLDLDPNNNPQIVGGNPEAGWFQFRIPIRKPTSRVGEPQFSNMQYVRFRVEGGRFACEIADWKLIGNYWQRSPEFEENYDNNDSVLQVSYVNLWENAKAPDYYAMPPGVQAPRQVGSLDYTVNSFLNEQSLSLSVKNLLWGEERMAVKVFSGQDLDFFNYKKLKYFIHGDGSMPMSLTSATGNKPKAYSFVRFGIDSGNYYEYRKPVVQDWQEIEIDLAQLTAIKQVRDTMHLSDRIVFPVPNDPTAYFAIKGSPILTKVKFVGIGIANPSDNFQELTTTMWVDELRLLSPEASNDWAGVANFSANLADLGTINFVFSNYEPNFHGLEERYGDRNQTRDWSVVLTGNLEKFAPKSFATMQIPISYSHLEKIVNPRYVASNDIELAAAANAAYNDVISRGGSVLEAEQAADGIKLRSSSLMVQDGWSLTGVKTGIPIKHWLVTETINRITTSYSYSQIYERSPVYEERFGWVWRLSANYNLPVPDLLTFKPLSLFGDTGGDNSKSKMPSITGDKKLATGWPANSAYKEWKINPLPSNITLLTDMTRKRQTEQTRVMEQPSPVVREFTANRGASFNWKISQGGLLSPTLDYKIIMGSTFVPWELDPIGRQRTGSELADIILMNNGRLIDFGINTNHQQDISINIKPLFPNFFNLNRIIDITGAYTSSYRWQDPLQQEPSIRDASRRSSVNGALRGKITLKLNQILNPRTLNTVKMRTEKDTTKSTSNASSIIKSIFTTMLNWDNLDFNFNRTTGSQNVGLYGGTGLDNIWVSPFNSKIKNGASMSYQLGLVSEPHSTVSLFPMSVTKGIRPLNSVLQDNYNESNTIDIKTGRALWEGARIDLTWKLQQQWNRNWTIDVDSIGNMFYSNIMSQDNLNRTFLSVPDFFGLHLFGNPVEKIVSLFENKRAVLEANFTGDSLSLNTALHEALNDAFYEGLEMLSFTDGTLGKILPAVNWTFKWEGLEKWAIWKGMIKRLSIEHNYTSTYTEIGQRTDMGRIVQTQSMQSGFNPLFGVTASFDEKLLNGVLTTSIKWSETSNYSATTASGAIISLQQSTDITANASYIMKGFSMPFMGFDLKNDFELSFLFTYKRNNTGTFDVLDPKSYSGDNASAGRTLTGNTQIIVEPRARYQISQMITASLFFRYEGTFNEGAANPGFFNTQVGLDIMINISGGR